MYFRRRAWNYGEVFLRFGLIPTSCRVVGVQRGQWRKQQGDEEGTIKRVETEKWASVLHLFVGSYCEEGDAFHDGCFHFNDAPWVLVIFALPP
jgi:hypothetical protein